MSKQFPLLLSLLLILPIPIYPKKIKPPTTLSPEHVTISVALALGGPIALIIFNKYLHKKTSKLRKVTGLAASFLGAYALATTLTTYIPLYCSPVIIHPRSPHDKKRRLARLRKHSWNERFG